VPFQEGTHKLAIFILSYDLVKKKTEFDYEILWSELKRIGAHRVQESHWLLNLANTAKEVVEHFQGYVHADDKLWASTARKDQYWFRNANGGTTDWLKQNPPT